MENEIKKFSYESSEIRTFTDDNELTWFVGVDVCSVLDLQNVTDSLKKLDDDEKLIYKLSISGQKRDTWTINESGLYHLILTSTKPEAKRFRKWVTGVVLPSIRKAGKYSTNNVQKKDKNLLKLHEEIEDMEGSIKDSQKELREMKNNFKILLKTDPNQLEIEFPEDN